MAEKKRTFSSDMERLDYLKDKIMSQVQDETISLKVSDLLKILEIQKKLSADMSAEEAFWEIIERMRQEELNDD